MRRRNRRRRGEEPENRERWLITYADLITLLLIFFVVLYAMSQIDIKKYEVLAQALQFEFRSSNSVLEGGTGVLGSLDPGMQPQRAEQPGEDNRRSAADERATAEQLEQIRERELQDLLKVVQAYIEENGLEQQITVADIPQGIAIRLNDLFLFDLGKADLKQEATPVLDRLASLFASLDNTLRIEGHTDNLPLQPGSAFRDNWELSAARSLSVVRYFVDGARLDPAKFESAAYADTRPVATNDTEAGRQRNRRVEITVLRE